MTNGAIRQSMFAAMQTELAEFQRLLAILEEQCSTRRHAVSSSDDDGRLTLLFTDTETDLLSLPAMMFQCHLCVPDLCMVSNVAYTFNRIKYTLKEQARAQLALLCILDACAIAIASAYAYAYALSMLHSIVCSDSEHLMG